MRILFVAPYVPNLIRVRSFQIISHLLRQGHDLTVATVQTPTEDMADVIRLQGLGAQIISQRLASSRAATNCLRAVPSRTPLQAVYSWHPDLVHDIVAQCFSGQSAAFDAIHVEHLRGANYGLWLKKHLPAVVGPARPPIVWDSVDCISHLFGQAAQRSRSLKGRLMTRFELGRTQRYEGWLVGQFEHVTVTSPVDRQALERLWQAESDGYHGQRNGAMRPITVLPNGVDLDYFTAGEEQRAPATIVFSGKMSYHANVSAALHLVNDIMPRVWSVNSAVRVVLAGKDPSQQIRQLAQQHPGRVEVTGAVPDIRPHLRRATVAVAPMLYSAGIQNKVLEAMACSTPVIAYPQAISALSVRVDRDLVVAGDEASFAAEILALVANSTRQGQIGEAGRAYAEREHSWNSVARQLETIYQIALNSMHDAASSSVTPRIRVVPESMGPVGSGLMSSERPSYAAANKP